MPSQPPLLLEPLTTPPASSDLFPADEWLYDPISRTGMPIDSIRPCSCGSTTFLMLTRGEGSADHHTYCDRCYANPRYRMSRPEDLIYGRLDVNTLEVVQLMPTDEILQRRAALARATS